MVGHVTCLLASETVKEASSSLSVIRWPATRFLLSGKSGPPVFCCVELDWTCLCDLVVIFVVWQPF